MTSTPSPNPNQGGNVRASVPALPISLDKRVQECDQRFKQGLFGGAAGSGALAYLAHKIAESKYAGYSTMSSNARVGIGLAAIALGAYATANWMESKCRAENLLPPKK